MKTSAVKAVDFISSNMLFHIGLLGMLSVVVRVLFYTMVFVLITQW